MANEKILNTRIQLKYDSYTNWTTANTLLKQGEVAIATLAEDLAQEVNATSKQPILMKVGPGNFNSLPWMSALAADVHAWAKKTEAEFTAWVGTLPNTITLNVNNVDKKYSIEDAIKLVRSEITAGGEAAAITVDSAYKAGEIKYVVKQGGTEVVKSIVVKADDGLTTTNETIKLSDATKASLAKADSAVQKVELKQLDPVENGVTLVIAVDDDVTKNRTDIKGQDFIKITASGTNKANTVDDPGNITFSIDSTKFASAAKAIEVDKAVEAGKTTKALTVKVGGADVVFDGSAAKTADVDAAIAAGVKEAKDYADAKPHENTAHTHSVGNGLKQSSAGGISGEVKTELNLKLDMSAETIYLRDAESDTVIAELDATSFVKDSYLKNVAYDAQSNILTFTFVDNEDNLQAIPVDLTDLVDVYTADEASLTKKGAQFSIKDGGVTTIKIADAAVTTTKIANDAITADKIIANAVTTAKIADKAVTEAKLADAVATKINNAFNSVSVTKADLGVEGSEHVALSFGDNSGSEHVEFFFKGGNYTSAVIDDSYTLNSNGEADHAIEIKYDVNEASDNTLGVVSLGQIIGLAQDEIAKLDKTVTGMSAAKTLKTLTETDGVISATFQDIKIEPSQVNNLVKTIQDNSIQSVRIAEGADLDEYESDGKTSWALKADDNIVVAFASSNTVTAKKEFDENAEGKYYASFDVKDHAIGAQHLKSEDGYNGADAEIWVFNCGSATINV